MIRPALKRELEKFPYCSGLLEERIAKAYEHSAKLVDDKPISCLLSFIARDSFKHAECFIGYRRMFVWQYKGLF